MPDRSLTPLSVVPSLSDLELPPGLGLPHDEFGSIGDGEASDTRALVYAGCLSTLALEQLARETAERGPSARRLPAVALAARLDGLDALVDEAATLGREGAEQLADLLNGCVGALVDEVHQHGGDAVHFDADSLLAVWTAQDDDGLETAARKAAQCALHLRAEVARYGEAHGLAPTLCAGLGAGFVFSIRLGGVRGRRRFVLVGAPLVDAGAAQRVGGKGEVVLAPSARRLLRRHVDVEDVRGYGRLVAVAEPLLPYPAARKVPPGLRDRTEPYVPLPIRARVEAGRAAWLAELRSVSVVFVRLPDIDHHTPLDDADACARAVQSAVDRYDGEIERVTMGDQGATFVAAFGLPPLERNEVPLRAIKAALALRRALSALGHRSSVGVATGEAFCGEVGTSTRRAYVLAGAPVREAARLATGASGGVLVDSASALASERRIDLERQPGRGGPVCYRPLRRFDDEATGVIEPLDERVLVGRSSERVALVHLLSRLAAGRGGLAMVEGAEGSGKTALVGELPSEADAAGVGTHIGRADPRGDGSLYGAWRGPLTALLRSDGEAADRTRLRPILGGGPPADEGDPVDRADAVARAVVDLLRRATRRRPRLLVLEDAQWFDSGSWSLVEAAHEARLPLLILLTSRPAGLASPAGLRLRRSGTALHLGLAGLRPSETAALVRRGARVPELPAALEAALVSAAAGNPLRALESGRAHRGGAGAPDLSLEALFAQRLDGLAGEHREVLEAAAILGPAFSSYRLRELRLGSDEGVIEGLGRAVELGLVVEEPPAAGTTHRFVAEALHRVVWEGIPVERRRALHLRAAELLGGVEALDRAAPELVHHFREAGDDARTLDALDAAGAQAAALDASEEVLRWTAEALSLARVGSAPVSALRAARWERRLAEAHLRRGDGEAAREHVRRALRLLEEPDPAAGLGALLRSLLVDGAVRALRRLLPALTRRRSRALHRELQGEVPRILEAARCHLVLAEDAARQGRSWRSLAGSARALNLAEPLGPRGESALGFVRFAGAAGRVGLRGWSRRASEDAALELGVLRGTGAAGRARLELGLHHHGAGRFALAEQTLEAAGVAAREAGLSHLAARCRAARAELLRRRGRAVEAERDLLDAGLPPGTAAAHLELESAALFHATGRTGRAEESLRRAAAPPSRPDVDERLRRHGLEAAVHLRGGRRESALRAAREWVREATDAGAVRLPLLESGSGACEVLLAEALRAETPTERTARLREAERAVFLLEEIGRAFPVCAPRAALFRGLLLRLRRRTRKGKAALRRAILEAERLDLPEEAAWIRRCATRWDAVRVERSAERRSAARSLREPSGSAPGAAG